MGSFTSGLITGCLLGVAGTFVLILAGTTFAGELQAVLRGQSLKSSTFSLAVLLLGAGISHFFQMDKDSSVLLFLFLVWVIARLAGMLNGLFAAFVSAIILSVWIFQPVGSLMIKAAGDRVTLALFLLFATVGMQIFRDKQPMSR